MPEKRRDVTLHLVFLEGERAAVHTLHTDQVTYYGSNVAEAARATGLPARPLRRLAFTFHGEEGGVIRAESVWHLEAQEGTRPDWAAVPDLSPQARGWVDAARTPPSNVPWMHPGWFAGALAWLDAELSAQGWRRHGDPRVLKHWQISALWQVETTHGNVYFKAVPDFFRREVELTPRLARELPGAAPRVLAADLERGFLLLEDAGEPVDEAELDLSALMRHLARLQRGSVPLLGAWNLRDRGPEYVRTWLDHLLSDNCLMTGQEGGFTPEEAAKLRAGRPALDAALGRLSASPLPRTLGHGDLHGGNVAARGGEFTILDWSDVCRTHPFLDVDPGYFLPDPWENRPDHADTRLAAATDAYLREWADLAPLDELRPLFQDGRLAAELYRALGYVDGIQPAVEDQTEWAGAHLLHLRGALRLLAEHE